MTKDEAFLMAIEALENADYHRSDEAITAIKAALEAKDEPVAFVETKEVHGQMCSFIYRADSTKLLPDGTKLYTTPPQRTWVGLTDEEILVKCESVPDYDIGNHDLIQFAQAIEAKLKEKNT